jgi:glycosyltransferase involved in cell wall biosynthesis/O-antigen/teichoic acid export membrane protein
VRILHVINLGTACGGAERLVAAVARQQRLNGDEVLVLSSDLPGEGARFSDVTWPEPRPPVGVFGRLRRQLRNPSARAALADLLDRWRPDVVHLHTVLLLSPASLRVLTTVPTVLTLHGPEVYLPPTARWCLQPRYFRPTRTPAGRLPLRDRLTVRGRLALLVGDLVFAQRWRRALRVVDVRTAPSRHQAAIGTSALGPTRVLPNALVDPGPAAGAEVAEVPAGPAGQRLLYFGRFEPFKGPQVLVAAMPAVLAEHPRVRLRLCGSGSLVPALRRQIDDLGLAGSVELVDWLDPAELAAQLAATDVVVVPSIRPESFGLACLEALAAGKPVVAFAVGAVPDLVHDEENGLLVPLADVGELAAAVIRLLADEPLRHRLGMAGAAFAAHFDLPGHVRKVAAAYRDAIDIAAGRGRAPSPRPPGRAALALAVLGLPGRIRVLLRESLLRNSMMLVLAAAELSVGGFLFWQLAAHLFTLAEVGRAGVLISASTLIATLALLGMNSALVRYLAEWPDPARTMNSGMVLVAAVAAVGALGYTVVTRLVAPDLALAGGAGPAAGFVLLTVCAAVSMYNDSLFIAVRRSGFVLGRTTLIVLLRLVVPLALIGAGASGLFVGYWLPVAVATAVYFVVIARRLALPPRPRLDVGRLRAMWRYGAGYYAASTILTVPMLVMPLLVAHRLDAERAAYFYVAFLLAGLLAFAPQAMAQSLFAELNHDASELRRLLVRVSAVLAGTQLPLLLLVVGGGRFVLGLFGPSYAQAYPLLVLLALSLTVGSVGVIGGMLLLVWRRLRQLSQLAAVACVVTLAGAYLLADRGLVWVGWSILAGQSVLAVGYLRVTTVALRTAVPDVPVRELSNAT